MYLSLSCTTTDVVRQLVAQVQERKELGPYKGLWNGLQHVTPMAGKELELSMFDHDEEVDDDDSSIFPVQAE